MKQSLLYSFRIYLLETIWNFWIGSLATILMVYELVRNFIPMAALPLLPTYVYWALGVVLLLVAPFSAFLKQQKRANLFQLLCKQIFEETFVFLNYGRESRSPPGKAIREGMALLEKIGNEVQAGDFSRAGIMIPLFHEMHNLVLSHYGGATEGTAKYLNTSRAIVDQVLAEGFPTHAISAQLRSESFEIYRQRWMKSAR